MNQGCCQLQLIPVNYHNARKYSGFAFGLTGTECSAAQVSSFICHINLLDMHKTAHLACQGMLDGHLGSAAIAGCVHIQQ
jgi:hypothetical protein